MCTNKYITRFHGSRLLISSLPGLASRTHVKSLSKPCDSTSVVEALAGSLYINKDTHLVFATRLAVGKVMVSNGFFIHFVLAYNASCRFA